MVDPPEELLTGQEFMRQLPERARWAEETAFITDTFEHVAQAHEHLAKVCVNVSALAKGDGQGHPVVHHKWGCETVGSTEHPRGVPEPS